MKEISYKKNIKINTAECKIVNKKEVFNAYHQQRKPLKLSF